MNSKKEVILITGANGRIGFHAAAHFVHQFEIVGFDVFLVGNLPDIEFVTVDIVSDQSMKDGLEYLKNKYGNKIASVIHLAAYYSFDAPESPNYDKITVEGTQRLLKYLQPFEVEQFIFSSTMLVHQPTQPGVKITEKSPLYASWGYPRSKIKTEKIIHEQRGNIPAVILRIAGVYDDHCHSIPLSHQLQRIFENQLESHVFAGDVTHGAPFVHMDDLIDALSLCVEKRHTLPPDVTFLIGEDVTFSYDQLQRMMQKQLFGKEWKTWSVPKPVAKIGAWTQDHLPGGKENFIKPWMIDHADDHFELDITQAKKLLGWEPKHRMDQVIAKWIEELKKDPIMWYDENKLKIPRRKLRQKASKRAA